MTSRKCDLYTKYIMIVVIKNIRILANRIVLIILVIIIENVSTQEYSGTLSTTEFFFSDHAPIHTLSPY